MKPFQHKVFSGTLFLVLLPLFFVLHGFTEHMQFVKPTDAILLAAFYIASILVFAFLLSYIFRSWRKAALYSFILFGIHFFFGSFHDALKQNLGAVFITKYIFLLPCVLAVMVLVFILIKKTTNAFQNIFRYLNALLLLLLLFDIVIIVANSFNRNKEIYKLPQYTTLCDSCKKPDVYLIIADEYPGQRALQDLFGYDNRVFYTALQSRGFHNIENSKSNYNFTPFSVASLLNYNYLALNNVNSTLNDVPRIMQEIKENKVISFFAAHGYHIVNNSFFELQGLPSETGSSFLPSNTSYITAQTLLSRLRKDVYFNFATRFKVKWVVEEYFYFHKKANKALYNKTLNSLSYKEKPKFSYTHLMMPHYPYFFDEAGNENAFADMVEESNKEKFIAYLKYSNKKYLALIDEFLKKAASPPIIILVSDHGFRSFNKEKNREYNFMNTCSIYLPGKNYSSFYNGLSNVNVFRLVLNTQFGQRLPLLQDSSIYLKD